MSDFNDGIQVNRVPILKVNDFDMWKIRIKQYILLQDYMIWEAIEYGTQYEQAYNTDGSKIKPAAPRTEDERRIRQAEMKALSTLLLAIPNEYQHQFEKYTNSRELWNALEKRFEGTASTKRNQRSILKQQYENFGALMSHPRLGRKHGSVRAEHGITTHKIIINKVHYI